MNKILICYFSASGVTRSVSEKLASFLNGDLFEIKPSEEYTAKDLDWENQESRSSKEMADHSSRPKIKEKLTDIEKYETILIGYPIWWDLAPRIINTFMETTNFENKKIYLFATSGGSSINESIKTLKEEYPNLNFISGKRLSETVTKEEIYSWIGEVNDKD